MLNRYLSSQVIEYTNNATLYKCLKFNFDHQNFSNLTKHMLKYRKIRPYIHYSSPEDFVISRLRIINPKTGHNYVDLDIFKDLSPDDIKYISRISLDFHIKNKTILSILDELENLDDENSLFAHDKNDKILKFIITNLENFTDELDAKINVDIIIRRIMDLLTHYHVPVNKNKIVKWIMSNYIIQNHCILQTNTHIYLILNLNVKITKQFYNISYVRPMSCAFHDQFHFAYSGNNKIDYYFKLNQKINKKNFAKNIKWIQKEFGASDKQILDWISYCVYSTKIINRNIAYFYLKEVLHKTDKEIIKAAINDRQITFILFVLFGEKFEFIDKTVKQYIDNLIRNNIDLLFCLYPYAHYIFMNYVLVNYMPNRYPELCKHLMYINFLLHKFVYGNIICNSHINLPHITVDNLKCMFLWEYRNIAHIIYAIIRDIKYFYNDPKRYIEKSGKNIRDILGWFYEKKLDIITYGIGLSIGVLTYNYVKRIK